MEYGPSTTKPVNKMSETKIIVLDDDPTGSQTVHGCLLLTRWDKETLRESIIDDSLIQKIHATGY